MNQTLQWILFDLGGVLYHIDSQRCEQAFAQLRPAIGLQELYHQQPEIFHRFDTGKLSAAGFRDALRSAMQIEASDREIDAAWNQLLIGLFPRRLELLQEVRKQWHIALLSNTNPIHAEAIFARYPDLPRLFEEVILSYQVGFRKPEPAIFQLATHLLNAPPEHILFVDDVQDNIQAAAAQGFQTLWLTDPEQLETEIYLRLVSSE